MKRYVCPDCRFRLAPCSSCGLLACRCKDSPVRRHYTEEGWSYTVKHGVDTPARRGTRGRRRGREGARMTDSPDLGESKEA